ncbi:MAG: hypothetical protein ACRCYU_22560 [Nocardioides sp.]
MIPLTGRLALKYSREVQQPDRRRLTAIASGWSARSLTDRHRPICA